MQKSKSIALGIGVIGMIIAFLMWGLPNSEDLGRGADNLKELTGFQSFSLGLGIWFTVLLVVATFIYFLVSYFNDFKIHPSFRREMRTITIYFFGSLVLGLILAAIFGGTDPVTKGNGVVVSSKGQLMFISTIIWTAIVMLIAAFVWSMKPLFVKKS